MVVEKMGFQCSQLVLSPARVLLNIYCSSKVYAKRNKGEGKVIQGYLLKGIIKWW